MQLGNRTGTTSSNLTEWARRATESRPRESPDRCRRDRKPTGSHAAGVDHGQSAAFRAANPRHRMAAAHLARVGSRRLALAQWAASHCLGALANASSDRKSLRRTVAGRERDTAGLKLTLVAFRRRQLPLMVKTTEGNTPEVEHTGPSGNADSLGRLGRPQKLAQAFKRDRLALYADNWGFPLKRHGG